MKVLQQEQAQCITVGSKRGGGGAKGTLNSNR